METFTCLCKAAVKNELTVGADTEQEQSNVQNTPQQELLAASLLFHILIYHRGIFTVFSETAWDTSSPSTHSPALLPRPRVWSSQGLKERLMLQMGIWTKPLPFSKKAEVTTYKAPSTSKRSQTQNYIEPGIKRKIADSKESDHPDRKRSQKKTLPIHAPQAGADGPAVEPQQRLRGNHWDNSDYYYRSGHDRRRVRGSSVGRSYSCRHYSAHTVHDQHDQCWSPAKHHHTSTRPARSTRSKRSSPSALKRKSVDDDDVWQIKKERLILTERRPWCVQKTEGGGEATFINSTFMVSVNWTRLKILSIYLPYSHFIWTWYF